MARITDDNNFINATSINNHGTIVGYAFKTYQRIFYIGKKKKKNIILCRELVPVIWIDPSNIKEIKLFLDKDDEFSYLGSLNGRPHWLTIDDDNFIHFWFDANLEQYAGSIHINELD